MRKVFYILTRLNDEDVDWLAAVGQRQRLDVGSVLIRQGRAIEALIFVLDGQVSVTVDGVGEVDGGVGIRIGDALVPGGEGGAGG